MEEEKVFSATVGKEGDQIWTSFLYYTLYSFIDLLSSWCSSPVISIGTPRKTLTGHYWAQEEVRVSGNNVISNINVFDANYIDLKCVSGILLFVGVN